ncbi:MAG: hypothetical protein EZS28_017425 [Streblomastix strix]|uniref:Uncharacterized protein n=1 Tax=Streblomastix strix TaxID=222440 RepID=A0A5J4VWW9_9EUKA|nr:MAG: hypothetical protein EZS28_017425 [Streblomastix strix]
MKTQQPPKKRNTEQVSKLATRTKQLRKLENITFTRDSYERAQKIVASTTFYCICPSASSKSQVRDTKSSSMAKAKVQCQKANVQGAISFEMKPKIQFVQKYIDANTYIDLLSENLKNQFCAKGGKMQQLINVRMSFKAASSEVFNNFTYKVMLFSRLKSQIPVNILFPNEA